MIEHQLKNQVIIDNGFIVPEQNSLDSRLERYLDDIYAAFLSRDRNTVTLNLAKLHSIDQIASTEIISGIVLDDFTDEQGIIKRKYTFAVKKTS